MQFGDDDKKDCHAELLHFDNSILCFQLYQSRPFEQSFTCALAVGTRVNTPGCQEVPFWLFIKKKEDPVQPQVPESSPLVS